jgi:hypothetical protein
MIELKTKSPDMENHFDIGAVLMSFISIVAVFPNVSVRVKSNVFEPLCVCAVPCYQNNIIKIW